MSAIPFADLARAAYCPRQCYYARREDDRSLPETARERIALAFSYPALRAADDGDLAAEPIRVPPATYRCRLEALADRDDWAALCDPARREVVLTGRECRGRVHKVLDRPGGPVPVVVSPGEPPDNGVWKPVGVRATAAAKALSWTRETRVQRAVVEFPAVGVIRDVDVTARRRGAYRRAVRTVEAIDGPPSRTSDRGKCERCEYRTDCGVTTRSLRSLLGL
ncbi:MAG: hypothetical protein ABEJ79_08190 [Halolamina sp.]